MERLTTTKLCIGAWCVNPKSGDISRNGESAHLEARTMRLLLCLAERHGEVVSIDELLNKAWPDVAVAPDSVYQAITSLRRLLGDDPKQPTYIATVPRLGYRMVATVKPWADHAIEPPGAQEAVRTGANTDSSRPASGEHVDKSASDSLSNGRMSETMPNSHLLPRLKWTIGAVLFLALVGAFLFRERLVKSNKGAQAAGSSQIQKSVAVLPFLDLTDEMNQEPFADGMTEELIDKLTKIPRLRVPPPTSSFYFKGKLWPRSHGTSQITIAEIAKSLGVACVLDGSVRKSGSKVRIDARLIRADNGYVIWSETYDRSFNDILMVQDDIAGQVAKALKTSIEAAPN